MSDRKVYPKQVGGTSNPWPDKGLYPELNSPVLVILKTEDVRQDETARLGSFLSGAEKEKSQRFLFPRDRVSYTLVHGLLRGMLGEHLGIAPGNIEITYNTFGRPFISGYSKNIFFNLSHSSGISVLAFDPDHEIGVDVEWMDDQFDYDPIIQLYFTERERQFINLKGENPRERFYEIWTRKEAFLKAVGIGITESLQVEVLGQRINANAVKESGSRCREFLFRSAVFEQNYRITLAVGGNSQPVSGFIPWNNNDQSTITI